MEALVIKFLTTLTFSQTIIMIIISALLYFVYLLINKNSMQSEIYDIKETKRAELWSYISGELGIIKIVSITRVKNYIDGLTLPPCDSSCGNVNKITLINNYKNTIKDAMLVLFELIKTNMRINHFKDKTGVDLDLYINEKAEMLLAATRNYIADNCEMLACASDYDRFTLSEAEHFYRKMVNQAILLKKEESIEIANLKKKYSIFEKLNFIKKNIQ